MDTTVTHNDEGGLNIQNDYFNNARKNRTRITVFLTNGQRITGLIKSFDKFTVIMETRTGDQMLFKHAITSVATALPNDRDGRGPRPQHRPGDRPPQGDQRRQHAGGPPSGRPGAPGGPGAPSGGPGGPGGAGGAGGPGGAPRDSAGPPRSEGDTRARGGAGPQGKQFGNFMDLSSVIPQAPGAEPAASEPASKPQSEAEGATSAEAPDNSQP